MKNSTFLLFVISVCFSVAVVLFAEVLFSEEKDKDHQDRQEITYQKGMPHNLSIDQKREIITQVGLSGFELMVEFNCNFSVAERMNTGQWVDSWCGDKYKHLELD